MESYKKLKLLGQGSFGKAFLVQCASDKVSKVTRVDARSHQENRHQEDER
jgi:predicted Ser/Thr protein kinase